MINLVCDYLSSLLSLSSLMMVSLISPGPDFAIVVKNSLIYSRRTALLTALGIAFGILVHVSYTLLGLGVILQKSVWLFTVIKYSGAVYLLYIGYKGLRAKKTRLRDNKLEQTKDISALSALGTGFLTNALNPKCMLFFISLFSMVIAPNTPPQILGLYGVIIFLETLGWFSFVAFCLSGQKTRERFNAVGHWIERVTGGILVGLGAKLFFVA
jgi:RhtB (resistance to homoserine/threonine) family protein